jgi:hypothetical protein
MHRKVSLSRTSWLVKLLPLLLFLGACATGAIREKQLTLPVIDGATSVGQEACAECHEGMSAGVHSRLAGFEYMGGTEGCEARFSNLVNFCRKNPQRFAPNATPTAN